MIKAIPIEETIQKKIRDTITVAGKVIPKPQYSIPGLILAFAILGSKLMRSTLGTLFLSKAVYDTYVSIENAGKTKKKTL